MKKVLSLLLVSLIVFVFASCGEKQENNVSSEAVSSIQFNKLVPEHASKGMIDTVIFMHCQ